VGNCHPLTFVIPDLIRDPFTQGSSQWIPDQVRDDDQNKSGMTINEGGGKEISHPDPPVCRAARLLR